MEAAHIWTKTIKSLQAHSLIPRFPYCSPSTPTHPPSHQVALNDRFTVLPTKMAFECRKVSEGPCWAASWGGVTGHWTLKWAVSVTKGLLPWPDFKGIEHRSPHCSLCVPLWLNWELLWLRAVENTRWWVLEITDCIDLSLQTDVPIVWLTIFKHKCQELPRPPDSYAWEKTNIY